MRPSTAANRALDSLEEKDAYTVAEAVELAITLLADQAEQYRDEFLRIGMTKKVKDAMRNRGRTPDPDQMDLDFLTDLAAHRVTLRTEGGLFLHKATRSLVWGEMNDVADDIQSRSAKVEDEKRTWKHAMEKVAPLMKDDPDLTFEEALKQLGQNTLPKA